MPPNIPKLRNELESSSSPSALDAASEDLVNFEQGHGRPAFLEKLERDATFSLDVLDAAHHGRYSKERYESHEGALNNAITEARLAEAYLLDAEVAVAAEREESGKSRAHAHTELKLERCAKSR